jgi:predicted dehydrogenase
MSINTVKTIMVIGCGSVGERHIRNLKSIAAAAIIACDPDRQRREHIKNTYGIKVFRNYREAFQNHIDAVLVCTPTSAHVRPAMEALRHRCHVFIEKPISYSLRGVDDLIELADSKGLVLMVGFNLRFHPAMQRMKELIEKQQIGRLIELRAHAGSYFLYRQPYHAWRQDYRQDYAAKKVGGGVILDSATHHIDYITYLLGEVKEVFCYADRMGQLALEAEDTADILMKFETGTVASLHTNFVQQPYQVKYEIIGEKGTIVWDITDNVVRLFSGDEDKWQDFPIDRNFDHNETYVREISDFLDCISWRKKPSIDGNEGKKIGQDRQTCQIKAAY